MKIDITERPPKDIFRDRSKYLWTCIFILTLAVLGLALLGYNMFSAMPENITIERLSLTIITGSALFFFYFGEKLKSYKRLGPQQKEKLAALAEKHAEIALYIKRVEEEGRQPIYAEYEACKEWAELEGKE